MKIEFCDRCLKAFKDDDDKYTFPLMGFRHYNDNDILVDGKDINTTRLINLQLPF